MQSLVRIGIITKTHGLNGSVKVIPDGSNLDSYLDLKKVFIGKSEQLSDLFTVKSSSIMQNHLLFEFDLINTIEQARKLLKLQVYVTEKDYDKLDIQILDVDLSGFKIFDLNSNKLIGEISKFEITKAHPVLTVTTESEKEVMIPFVDDWVVHVRKKSKVIEMELPDGILDI